MATEAQILAWLRESLERSPCGNTLEDIIDQIREGHARLWVGDKSCAVTQFVATERIWHAAGEMEDLINTMTRAKEVMRQHGVERLLIENTRKGWTKALRPYGFEPVQSLVMDF